jgi:hypothetical protein
MATKAFDKLSNYINPYIDELVGLDAFHRFTDLPLELRQMLYEQYFADEHSVALKAAQHNGRSAQGPLRRSAPVQPSLATSLFSRYLIYI